MLQPGPSTRSEELAGPGPGEWQEQCRRLQLLVGELLQKNHELRCELARLNRPMPPVRFALSKTIFDWEIIG